jgi:hypothetical protein
MNFHEILFNIQQFFHHRSKTLWNHLGALMLIKGFSNGTKSVARGIMVWEILM